MDEKERLVNVEKDVQLALKILDEHNTKIEKLSDVYLAITNVNNKVDNVITSVSEVKCDLKELKEKPNKRVETAKAAVISSAITFVVCYVLSQIFK